MLEARSAIAGLLARGGRDGAGGRRRLRLGERRGRHLIQLGHYAGTAPAFEAAVRGVLGHDLPHSPREAHRAGHELALRVAPDQHWLLTTDAGRVAALVAAVPGDVGSVLPLSASRTCIVVDGADARAVLAKLVPIDLHPAAFAVGCFAQTGMHHVGGLLYRADADRYEFFALRTYGATMWEAIADAALPFGYEIVNFDDPA